MADMAKNLMIIYAILAILKFIYLKTPWTWGIAQAMKTIMTVIAAGIALLGLMMMGMGRSALGTLYTAEGAVLAIMAMAEGEYGASASSTQLWLVGGQAIIASLSKCVANGVDKERTFNSDTQQWE
jgi:hypothetical protein